MFAGWQTDAFMKLGPKSSRDRTGQVDVASWCGGARNREVGKQGRQLLAAHDTRSPLQLHRCPKGSHSGLTVSVLYQCGQIIHPSHFAAAIRLCLNPCAWLTSPNALEESVGLGHWSNR